MGCIYFETPCIMMIRAGAIEYTDCISAMVRPLPMSVLDKTLNYLMARLQ